jgi:hypothetical protein
MKTRRVSSQLFWVSRPNRQAAAGVALEVDFHECKHSSSPIADYVEFSASTGMRFLRDRS